MTKAALAFAVILEFVALGALEWPGIGHARASQTGSAIRAKADAASAPIAGRVEYAPCGIPGEAFACSP